MTNAFVKDHCRDEETSFFEFQIKYSVYFQVDNIQKEQFERYP